LVVMAAGGRKDAGPVAEQAGAGFGGLLRQLRDEAGLTQEELAGAARVSQRAVSDLERGINRTARKDTALLLADALGLDGQAGRLFVAAARGKAPVAEVLAARQQTPPSAFAAAATRSLPRDIASFTGRQAELAQLLEALAAAAAGGGVVGIHAIDGMAGIGKTTFAVHAAHRLAAAFPDGQFFLPLHAHTAGQRPVGAADALASLLLTAGVAAAAIPPGLEPRAARWRDHVAGKKILLVLDDAAGGRNQAFPCASAGRVLRAELAPDRRDDQASLFPVPQPAHGHPSELPGPGVGKREKLLGGRRHHSHLPSPVLDRKPDLRRGGADTRSG
jgi:transcriptional regulator with XRE-family HTH domain